jgi:hypothetical protein
MNRAHHCSLGLCLSLSRAGGRVAWCGGGSPGGGGHWNAQPLRGAASKRVSPDWELRQDFLPDLVGTRTHFSSLEREAAILLPTTSSWELPLLPPLSQLLMKNHPDDQCRHPSSSTLTKLLTSRSVQMPRGCPACAQPIYVTRGLRKTAPRLVPQGRLVR